MHQESFAPDPSRIDVLLVASFAPELRGVRTHLGERLDGFIRGLHVTAKTVGVGMAVAGGSMTRRALLLNPRCVIMLGTCGVYPGGPSYHPHDVIVANRITLLDHAVLAGKAAFPDPMQTTIDTHAILSAGLASALPRARTAHLASTLSMTTDDAVASTIFQATRCEAENLEAFAIAQSCAAASVPFAAVLGVSNIVGSRGRDDWRLYERQAGIAAAEVALTWVHNGAQGLPHGK